MNAADSYENFAQIKERLDEIVDKVSDDDLPLEQALSLYEEAVRLGARASELIEQAGIDEEDAPDAAVDADSAAVVDATGAAVAHAAVVASSTAAADEGAGAYDVAAMSTSDAASPAVIEPSPKEEVSRA